MRPVRRPTTLSTWSEGIWTNNLVCPLFVQDLRIAPFALVTHTLFNMIFSFLKAFLSIPRIILFSYQTPPLL
ncbi:hypothetical protein B9Z55_006516 [Caenorhabditis nigoni]|nr:hypothetical protein B9Z55_006516 [Caenorhabditis nigoni]